MGINGDTFGTAGCVTCRNSVTSRNRVCHAWLGLVGIFRLRQFSVYRPAVNSQHPGSPRFISPGFL